MNDEHLSDRLHAVVDDHILTAPDLLPRARAARNRRSAALTGAVALVAVAGIAGGAMLWSSLNQQTPALPANPTTSPSNVPEPADGPIPHDEIARLCSGQTEKYLEPNSLTRNEWHLPAGRETRDYRVGDLVHLLSTEKAGADALCRIPAANAVDVPVSFEDLRPAADDLLGIAEVCSESMVGYSNGQTPTPSYGTPDLRGAVVSPVVALGDGHMAARLNTVET
ncbi:MAG: hypothetical protein Q4G46_16095, partial [Propionibacteriaceae bacterium]|nr:hypothetical protein [Propionibacteriaceae bacterium]